MAYELIKVSELPELTAPSDPNVIPIQDGDYLKRISFENLKEAVTGDIADDLAAEVTARESAVSDEATARGNADTAILADLASPYSASSTYAVGDYCTKDGQLYRCTTAITTAEAWTAAHWSAVALGDDTRDLRSALSSVENELDDYAKTDGTYENMTSGNAEQLLSDVYTENSEPYLFRKTGGSDNVGDREYLDKIVGGTLNWNQLLNNDFKSGSYTWDADASNYFVTVHSLPVANRFKVYSGHKYFISAYISRSISGNNYINLNLQNVMACILENGVADGYAQGIKTPASDTVITSIAFNNYSGKRGFNAGDTASYDDFQLIDLTVMFGTAIADYAHALEQATAGAGVSWLKQYIDLDKYYAYDAGTLKHVEGLVSHNTTGKNLFDIKKWLTDLNVPYTENGDYVQFTPTSSTYSTFFPLPTGTKTISFIIGSNTTATNVRMRALFADGSVNNNVYTSSPFTGNIIVGVAFNWSGVGIIEVKAQVEFGSTATAFEPYQKRSYPLDSSVVLRGYPTLVDGKIKFDGDTYKSAGNVNRKYKLVNLGTITGWTNNAEDSVYVALNDRKSGSDKIITSGLIHAAQNTQAANMPDKSISTRSTTRIVVVKWAGITAANAQSVLNDIYLLYELETPTTESAEPFRQLQICDTYGTEEFVTTGIVPVGTETRYPEDLKSKIEGLPWDLSMIAPIEDGTTASQAYTTGQYFLRNNVFCKAKTNIASGATFTLNTNYSETTVAAELYAALH